MTAPDEHLTTENAARRRGGRNGATGKIGATGKKGAADRHAERELVGNELAGNAHAGSGHGAHVSEGPTLGKASTRHPERKSLIRDFLFAHGQTSVNTLARRIGMSPATLRRDLVEMEASGQIERVHGAARIARNTSVEVAFARREKTNLAAKRAIATYAFERIRPGAVIFLDAGTTVLQLARRIRMSGLALSVFTNGLAVANELVSVPGIEVNLIGGRVREENMSVAGAVAQSMLERLWFDQLFLGASAIDESLEITSFDADEARLNATMVARSSQTWIMADHTKFGCRATYSVLSLSAPHSVVTDQLPPEGVLRTADACGASIIAAFPSPSGSPQPSPKETGRRKHG